MTAALVQKQARVKNHTGRLVLVRSEHVIERRAAAHADADLEVGPGDSPTRPDPACAIG